MSRNPYATALRYVRQQRIERKLFDPAKYLTPAEIAEAQEEAAQLWHSLAEQAAEPVDDDAEDFGPLSHEERNRRWFGDA